MRESSRISSCYMYDNFHGQFKIVTNIYQGKAATQMQWGPCMGRKYFFVPDCARYVRGRMYVRSDYGHNTIGGAYINVYTIIFMPIGNFQSHKPSSRPRHPIRTAPRLWRAWAWTTYASYILAPLVTTYQCTRPPELLPIDSTIFQSMSVSCIHTHEIMIYHDNRHFTWPTTPCMIMHERYKSIISTPTWPLLFQSSSFFTFLLQKLISLVESLHEPAALAMFITMMYTLYGYSYLHVITVQGGMDGSGTLWSLPPHWCVIPIGKFVLQSGARLHSHRRLARILAKLQVRLSSMEGRINFRIFRPMPRGKSSFNFSFSIDKLRAVQDRV